MAPEKITVEEGLVAEAMELLGVGTRSEAIRLSLQQVVRRARVAELAASAGSIGLDIDRRALGELRRKG